MRFLVVACALGAVYFAASEQAWAQVEDAIVTGADVEGEAASPDGPGYFDDFANEGVGKYDLAAPDLDYVWVDGNIIPDGTPSEGFYRLRNRPGFTWANAHYENGRWTEGGWRPEETPKGKIWVEGHRGNDGYWVSGNWRPEVLPGFVWKPGRRDANVRVSGSWEPMEVLPDTSQSTWVAGYWDTNGAHLEGFWRAISRPGYTWKAGHWRYGQWRPGYWQPNKARHDASWSPGFWNGASWQSGQWRETTRKGFSWVEAYRGFRGRWVKGHWKRKRRTAPRRHRVFHVDDIARARHSQKTVWRANQPGLRAHDRAHDRLQHHVERVHQRSEHDRHRMQQANNRVERSRELIQRKHERIESRRRRKARQKNAVKKRQRARRNSVRH